MKDVILSDGMAPSRAQALAVTLGLGRGVERGDALPPFFHQIYFWDPVAAEALGRDGHPRVGQGLIPDLGLPRRMWAGGRLEFHGPLVAGETAEKRSRVEKTERKQGRSGPLAFVTLRHDITQNGKLRVQEYQDLVYREVPDLNTPAPLSREAPADKHAEDVDFTTTLLFRYSALTFNGHRIHYDADYAREVEGYAGLVTHGPLLAQLLMLKAERELGLLVEFKFRAVSPAVVQETLTFCRAGRKLWVRAPDGRLVMEAEAQ
ncbi:MaoC family dehydratase N-terminal domain-containing protein [Maritimibacter sp. DP1N21-5]|uniref:FAS1-like dehydratase domain-containing protein n=1 Tax=Maritimibacter sp. DP1N21-5 TaxID=2836867 RepID=UPI001C459B2B|nr:MaoC family dehydratase N-terminal domain-containing protein [Maritimibacter sp. DP1N21-5]MBV7408342.1 MaoC family dehydratase N-terminal domain-containing protein [Maritimibacter sp. DP1N21-5]